MLEQLSHDASSPASSLHVHALLMAATGVRCASIAPLNREGVNNQKGTPNLWIECLLDPSVAVTVFELMLTCAAQQRPLEEALDVTIQQPRQTSRVTSCSCNVEFKLYF